MFMSPEWILLLCNVDTFFITFRVNYLIFEFLHDYLCNNQSFKMGTIQGNVLSFNGESELHKLASVCVVFPAGNNKGPGLSESANFDPSINSASSALRSVAMNANYQRGKRYANHQNFIYFRHFRSKHNQTAYCNHAAGCIKIHLTQPPSISMTPFPRTNH